jgi:hypothetical protein
MPSGYGCQLLQKTLNMEKHIGRMAFERARHRNFSVPCKITGSLPHRILWMDSPFFGVINNFPLQFTLVLYAM